MKKLHFFIIISITLCLIIPIGCTTRTTYTSTVTKAKKLVFSSDVSIIQNNLHKIIKCENIKLTGYEIAENGDQSTSVVEVRILNGDNMPKEQDSIYMKAREIAREVQKSLKDSIEFQKYNVVFEINEYYGPISKEGIQTIEFNLKEL